MGVEEEEWDIAVIGAGMGGGTVGYTLAEYGYRVLFIERGASRFDITSTSTPNQSRVDDPEDRLRNGQWPTRITSSVDGVTSSFFAPMGCGIGGSTLLYPAALERFERVDFAPVVDESPVGTTWPISYDEFLPYYQRAERLYEVRGTPDPLNQDDDGGSLKPPLPLDPIDASLFDALRENGMHPYQVHLAVKGGEGCDLCPGRVCPKSCKSDSRRICVEPALRGGRCQVLDYCEVTRLEAGRDAVRRAHCVRQGRELQIRAKVFILSAGAYMSPRLLLASQNADWPRGLGNDRDQVGRHIMFHLMDLVAIWPPKRFKDASPSKSIGVRDFYRHEGKRFGLLQSMGVSAGYGNILYSMRNNLERSRLRGNRIAWHLLRVPAYLASRIFGRAAVFASIVEDLPYAENRIVLDPEEPGGIRVIYKVSDELRQRSAQFRKLFKRRFSGIRSWFLNQELALNYGHPCGSCRFGTDPATSVLDPSNRVHGVSNLYVVDSSFMPSSGGSNPSLTIAANAIRVGEIIHRRLSSPEDAPVVDGQGRERVESA